MLALLNELTIRKKTVEIKKVKRIFIFCNIGITSYVILVFFVVLK